MKLLVTGATGFVGNEVVKQLLAQYLDVIASVSRKKVSGVAFCP